MCRFGSKSPTKRRCSIGGRFGGHGVPVAVDATTRCWSAPPPEPEKHVAFVVVVVAQRAQHLCSDGPLVARFVASSANELGSFMSGGWGDLPHGAQDRTFWSHGALDRALWAEDPGSWWWPVWWCPDASGMFPVCAVTGGSGAEGAG